MVGVSVGLGLCRDPSALVGVGREGARAVATGAPFAGDLVGAPVAVTSLVAARRIAVGPPRLVRVWVRVRVWLRVRVKVRLRLRVRVKVRVRVRVRSPRRGW